MIIPALSACKKEIKNEEYDEYKIKATEVLNFNNVSSKKTFERKKVKYKIVENSSLYNKMNNDETKQEVYFEDTYTQFSELTFRIPLALGYAGNNFHKIDTFFGKVFKETAMTGNDQFVSTYKIDDYNYVTKMIASIHYIEARFNYVNENEFWFEWVSLNPTNYNVTAYYYGDSNKNLVGFGDSFAGIHISNESTGWTTNNQDTINYFKNNIEIDINENEVKNAQSSLSNSDYITISDKEFSESLSVVLDKPIANNGVDIDGWRNLGKVDTVYSYDGNETDTITIPSKYTKMYYDFAINSKVRKLVIPKTVTTIVDDDGNPTNLDEFILRTHKYANDEYTDYILEEIVVDKDSPLFSVKDGNLFSKNGKKLLYIVDNPTITTIDLRCDEFGDIDFETTRKNWSNIKNIIVDEQSLSFLNDYVNSTKSITNLDSLTIYEWNDFRLDINNQMFDLSLFKVKVLNIYGTFTEVFIDINEGDFGEVNYYSTNEYRVSGNHFGLKELIINTDSKEELGNVYYHDLEKIIIQEGIKDVNLSYISSDQSIEVYFPSTIENVYGMPLVNGTKEDRIAYVPYGYYWKNKLSEFPQIDYYHEESISWTIKLNDYASKEEKYIVDGFKDVVSNGESLTINNYYGEDTIVNIPSAIIGVPVNYVYFDENFANQYYERYGEMASANITELHIPLSVVSIGVSGTYHFEKVYYEGTKEQFPTTSYSWFDEAICSNGIITGGEMSDDNNIWTYEDTMVACEYNGLSFEFSGIKVNLKNDEYLIGGYINGNEVTSYEYYAEKYNETRASFNILMHIAGIGDIKIKFDFLADDNLFVSIILLDEIDGYKILSEFYLSLTN